MVKNLVFVIIASSIVVSCMIVKEPEKQAVAKNNAPSSIEKSIKKGYPEKNCASKSEGKNNLFLLPNDYVVDKTSSKRNGQYFIDYSASKRAPVDDANQKSYIDKAKERNEQTKHVLSQKRWHDAAEIDKHGKVMSPHWPIQERIPGQFSTPSGNNALLDSKFNN